MQFDIKKTNIPGCFLLKPKIFKDNRGGLIKIFHKESFKIYGLDSEIDEIIYTSSRKRVLRGLHFQLPPMDHVKLVCCISGQILDVAVDLRVGSPAFGKFVLFNLNGENANIIYLPKGLAHGYYVQSEQAIVMYTCSSIHSPVHDMGILWNSLPITWPDKKPILSQRDSEFISFPDFKSPFIYE